MTPAFYTTAACWHSKQSTRKALASHSATQPSYVSLYCITTTTIHIRACKGGLGKCKYLLLTETINDAAKAPAPSRAALGNATTGEREEGGKGRRERREEAS